MAFCSPGDEVIHALHGFEMYPIMTKICWCAESVLASEIDYKINIDSVIKQYNTIQQRLIFIANPNNPTGTYLNKHELRLLNEYRLPRNIVVVIDTAYAEFADAEDYDKTFEFG